MCRGLSSQSTNAPFWPGAIQALGCISITRRPSTTVRLWILEEAGTQLAGVAGGSRHGHRCRDYLDILPHLPCRTLALRIPVHIHIYRRVWRLGHHLHLAIAPTIQAGQVSRLVRETGCLGHFLDATRCVWLYSRASPGQSPHLSLPPRVLDPSSLLCPSSAASPSCPSPLARAGSSLLTDT